MVDGNRLACIQAAIKESGYKYGSHFLPSFIVSNSLYQPSIKSKSRTISPRLIRVSLYELQTVIIRERVTTKLNSAWSNYTNKKFDLVYNHGTCNKPSCHTNLVNPCLLQTAIFSACLRKQPLWFGLGIVTSMKALIYIEEHRMCLLF